MNHENLPQTATLLKDGIEEGLHVGGQIFVSLKGKILADEAFGESNPGRSMHQDDLVLWLSSTKPITAVVVGRQEEQGRLRWDDPVTKFIPEFGSNGKESITVRHLLNHTGGFRSADNVPEDLGWDETIAQICAAPLEAGWVPGQKAGYHSACSWFILGEIVRRLDSRPFEQYVRDEIFLPLGMNNSWIGMPSEKFRSYGERIAPMYSTRQDEVHPIALWNTEKGCSVCRPASNGRGPVRELARFYEWLLSPRTEPVLNRQTGDELTARQRVGMFDETFRHIIDWGLGFILNSNRYGIDTVPYGYGRHASEPTFGHSGSQSSAAFADPLHGLVVAWVLNGMPGEPKHQKRARAINTAIYEDLKLA